VILSVPSSFVPAQQEDSSYNRIKTLVNEELKQYFRPEFLNRLVRHAW